jgi:acetyltransferase-like isoleucine patch superfamily enzyme
MKRIHKMAEPGKGTVSFQTKMKKARNSPLKTYKDITVELLTFFLGPLPGMAGLALRSLLYPFLIKTTGKGNLFGRNLIIRCPAKLQLGNNVTIDDNVLIDARGGYDTGGISLADGVTINRNCSLKAKNGKITIGKQTTIGSNSSVVSYNSVEIGDFAIIAGGCSINTGGYEIKDTSVKMIDNGVSSKGPIVIGDDVWIGTRGIILEGIRVGSHAVIGAGAVVTKDVAEHEIVAGVPAKSIGSRLS